jgi:hypothetical protein
MLVAANLKGLGITNAQPPGEAVSNVLATLKFNCFSSPPSANYMQGSNGQPGPNSHFW